MTVVDAIVWLLAGLFLAVCLVVGYFVLATKRIAASAARRIPPVGKFVALGGDRIHYAEAGRGRTIFFLHGLGGQLHHFRHTMFDRLAGDFHVMALDRAGSGYSVRGQQSTGKLSEQATTIAAFIDALGLERPLVVGHSLGGAVALALAIDHPQKISGIALLSPLAHEEDTVRPEFAPLLIRSGLKRKILARTTAIPTALKYAPQTLAFVFGPQSTPKDYVVAGGGLLGLRPSHFEATVQDFVAIEHELRRYEARLEEIRLPVGVIVGTADKVLDHEKHGMMVAERTRAELEILDGIGHMLQFVAASEVEAFLRRMAGRAFT